MRALAIAALVVVTILSGSLIVAGADPTFVV